MSENLKRCKVCNIPSSAFEEHKWDKNGTWGTKGGHRIAYFPVGLWKLLFREMRKRIGDSPAETQKLILGAKIGSTSAYVDNVLVGLKGNLLRSKLLYKVAFKKLEENARFHGFGTYEIIEADYQKEIVLSAKDFYVDILGAGDLGGAFKSLYRKWPEVKWRKKEKEELILKARSVPREKADFIEAVSLSPPKTLEGGEEYKRCKKCGSPLELSETFQWVWDRGLLIEKISKERWCGTGIVVRSIFATIERELGRKISHLVANIIKDYFKENVLVYLEKTDKYEELFSPFRIRGWGDPVEISKAGKKLDVRINSPYDESFLAGVVGGYYEAVEKEKAKIGWTPNKGGYTLIKVEPE
jgi:hypothetical protein